MPDEPPRLTASAAYATEQLQRALVAAVEQKDPADRERAQLKVQRWQAVVAGMDSGHLAVGARAPITDTPVWVTPEVVHGGFPTGRYLADCPLTEHESSLVATLPANVPGTTDRERLNAWFLGDAGQRQLRDVLRSGRYRVDVPEEAALAVVVLLLDKGLPEPALELVAELRPFMHKLRLTPLFEPMSRSSGTAVRLLSVGATAQTLRAVTVPPQISAMRATLKTWNPLYDRLVALWCTTVDGDLPHLDEADAVHGGWPCRVWPADWAQRRSTWLADFEEACRSVDFVGRHAHRRSNFTRLRRALESCPDGSEALRHSDVGWIRRALANSITRHGTPGAPDRDTLRATQDVIADAPTHAALARVVANRLDGYPADGGLPSLDPIAMDVALDDEPMGKVPIGTPIPRHLLHKAARALEAPPDELVRRGVISSNETLAAVLPQLTARLTAAGINDPVLSVLYEQAYTAFRRRRSLLLLNLEHQVQFDELPWIAALQSCRSPQPDNAGAAHLALRQASMLAISEFPHTILPNPLIREFSELATQAELDLPLIEELAADIFMGKFTPKWAAAATIASRTMAGTLYARYYDLPPASRWEVQRYASGLGHKSPPHDFAMFCNERAGAAAGSDYVAEEGSWVAFNGAILEQGQILTTHNLATLVESLKLADQLRYRAPTLARGTFSWVIRRLRHAAPDRHSALIQIKNAAYAWRQAIFLLSFCEPSVQLSQLDLLRDDVRATGIDTQFGLAIDGLDYIVSGGTFTPDGVALVGAGRRFLGWDVGLHWYLTALSG